MSTKEQYWKYSLITIIIGLGIILARQITPFLGGLLGALTIYILVRRQMIYLSGYRRWNRWHRGFHSGGLHRWRGRNRTPGKRLAG